MPVKIHNKDYLTVAERVSTFRSDHPDYGIETDVIENTPEIVIVKATILRVLESKDGALGEVVVGTGYAEEIRGSSNINKTSALENCETSAIGRALAACGYGGEQYASANEVSEAIIKQEVMAATEKYVNMGLAIQRNIDSIASIKESINIGELEAAVEAFSEIEDDDKIALNVAPTKGGPWTIEEYKVFKSDDWSEARKSFFGIS